MTNDSQKPEPAVRSTGWLGREYRYEALCQVCWQQFELPHEDAEHVCRNCQNRPIITACLDCGENAPETGLHCNECREDSMGD